MYAILNTKTKKFVYGTDKSNGWPFYQRESSEQMITYSDPEIAKIDFRRRGCGDEYKIAKVSINIEQILPYK